MLQAQRPKLELEVPYKMYRLVRADGSAPERPNKHPFCMSRVYYDASEKPEEVRQHMHYFPWQHQCLCMLAEEFCISSFVLPHKAATRTVKSTNLILLIVLQCCLIT